MLRNILFGGESGLSVVANAGLTLLRVFTGSSLAIAHGIGKIPPNEGLIERATTIGFPAPMVFAWAAGLSEFSEGSSSHSAF